MARITKLFNNHIIMICTVIIATSFVALFFVNSESFYDTSSSSILAPEFDFNSKLKSNTSAEKKQSAIAHDELLMSLANEHIPIIMCAFYDLITGPKRLQKPDNVDEGRWLQQIWAELMEGMGIPAKTYMSIMELRYSWFTETKDTFESFQAKLEPSFVKATLERYIQSTGNFKPTSVDKYKEALQCKLYRVFSKSASLLNYMTLTTTQKPSTTQQSPTTQQSSSMQPTFTTTQQSPSMQPTSTTTQQSPSMQQSSSMQPTSTTTQQSSSMQPTSTAQPTSTTQQSSSMQPTSTTQQPVTQDAKTTDTKIDDSVKTEKAQNIPLLKWTMPSNFTSMCLEKGNRFQCFLMSILFVIAIVCVVAVVVTQVVPLISQRFSQQSQPQF